MNCIDLTKNLQAIRKTFAEYLDKNAQHLLTWAHDRAQRDDPQSPLDIAERALEQAEAEGVVLVDSDDVDIEAEVRNVLF